MKIALIVNPSSGKKKAQHLLPDVEKSLKHRRIDYHLHISRSPEHLQQLVSGFRLDQYDSVVSMGGDGTNFQVLNVMLNTFKVDQIPPLGIIPAGSGNSFAIDLNIRTVNDAVNAIQRYNPQPVDVCSFTQDHDGKHMRYYFVNLTGVGFVTDVADTADKFKYLNELSYLIGVILRGIFVKYHEMELIIDGKTIKGENLFVEFCNSRYTGGNMKIAPTAKIDDGLMDIIVAGKFSRMELFKTLPKIFTGKHLEHPLVKLYKARSATLVTNPCKKLLPDGEILGSTPAEFSVHPGLVRYL